MVAYWDYLGADGMQSYSFEIWDFDTCVGREVVYESDAEGAKRVAIVALSVFLLKRPDLQKRLTISVRDVDGSRISDYSAADLRGQAGACRSRAVGSERRGRVGTRLIYGDHSSEI